jgi:arylsulfatase A-like enzyme
MQRESDRRISQPVGLVDLAPTILELAGIRGESLGCGIDGQSFAAAITDGFAPAARLIRGEIGDRVVVLRDGSLKYATLTRGGPDIISLGTLGREGEILFDLGDDPDERADLIQDRPAVVRRMRALARKLASEPTWPHVDSRLDPEALKRLEGLGYVGN